MTSSSAPSQMLDAPTTTSPSTQDRRRRPRRAARTHSDDEGAHERARSRTLTAGDFAAAAWDDASDRYTYLGAAPSVAAPPTPLLSAAPAPSASSPMRTRGFTMTPAQLSVLAAYHRGDVCDDLSGEEDNLISSSSLSNDGESIEPFVRQGPRRRTQRPTPATVLATRDDAALQRQWDDALADLVQLERTYQTSLRNVWVDTRNALLDLAVCDKSTSSGGASRRSRKWSWSFFSRYHSGTSMLTEGDVDVVFSSVWSLITWHTHFLTELQSCTTSDRLAVISVNLTGLDEYVHYARNHYNAMLTIERVCRSNGAVARILDDEEVLASLTMPFQHLGLLGRRFERLCRLFLQRNVHAASSAYSVTPAQRLLERLGETCLAVRAELELQQPRLEVLDVQARFDHTPLRLTDDPARRLYASAIVTRLRNDASSSSHRRTSLKSIASSSSSSSSPYEYNLREHWFLFNDALLRAHTTQSDLLRWREYLPTRSLSTFNMRDGVDWHHAMTVLSDRRLRPLIVAFPDAETKTDWCRAFAQVTGQVPRKISTFGPGEASNVDAAAMPPFGALPRVTAAISSGPHHAAVKAPPWMAAAPMFGPGASLRAGRKASAPAVISTMNVTSAGPGNSNIAAAIDASWRKMSVELEHVGYGVGVGGGGVGRGSLSPGRGRGRLTSVNEVDDVKNRPFSN